MCKTGPWGQGPVFLQQLALLQAASTCPQLQPGSAEFIHTVTVCAKLTFAEREAWYGDPDFTDVPLDELLSKTYNDERRELVGATASAGVRRGSARGQRTGAAGIRHGLVRDKKTRKRRPQRQSAGERRSWH